MIKNVLKFLKLSNKEKDDSNTTQETNVDSLFETIGPETLRILIGEDIISFGDCINENIRQLRGLIKEENGFIFPAVHVKSDFALQENEIQFYVNEKLIYTDYAIPTETYIETTFLSLFKNIILDNIDNIFTNCLVEKYINFAQKDNLWMIWNLTNLLTISEIKAILIDLIKNKKSISNINMIFEKICDDIFVQHSSCSKDPHKISERLCKIL